MMIYKRGRKLYKKIRDNHEIFYLAIGLKIRLIKYKGFRNILISQWLLIIINVMASFMNMLIGNYFFILNALVAIWASFFISRFYINYKEHKLKLNLIIEIINENIDSLNTNKMDSFKSIEQ